MTNAELFNLLSKPWATSKDIGKIASCGRDNASFIRDAIRQEIHSSGFYLPKSRCLIVPMERVIQYLNLNIDHIASMAKKEQTILQK